MQDSSADRRVEMLVAEHKARLYAAALTITGIQADAEDLTWRTLERAVRRYDQCNDKSRIYEWMYSIMLNLWRNSRRGKVVRGSISVGASEDVDDAAERSVSGNSVTEPIDGAILREAIEHLPPKMRDVLVMHYFLDKSVPTIARFLMVAEGTVRSRLYYARLALAERLKVGARKVAPAVLAIVAIGAAFAASLLLDGSSPEDAAALAAQGGSSEAASAGETDGLQPPARDGALARAPMAFNSIPNPQEDTKMKASTTTKAVALVAALTANAAMAANVFDDCAWWFWGGRDADGDGRLATGEFYDEIHASDPSEAAHSDAVVTGTLTSRDEPMRRACDALSATNAVPVVYIPQDGSTATAYVNTSRRMNNVLDGHFDAYTLLFRVRRERNTTANATQTFALVGYSSYYNIGGLLRFVGDDDSADGKHIVYYINQKYWSQHYNTLKIPADEWVDIAVVVSGAKVRIGVARPTATSGANGFVFEEKTFSSDVMAQKGKGTWALFAEDATSGNFFSGSCQQVAIWPRALSDAEVVEAFGFPRPATWRVGLENDASGEFAAERTAATQAIDVLRPWHGVTPVMKAGDSWQVNFPLRGEQRDAGAQLLMVKPVSGSGALGVTVNGNRVRAKSVRAGDTQHFFIPNTMLRAGANSLTISRTDSGNADLVVDMLEMAGSWQLGVYGNAWGDFANEVYVTDGLASSADMNPQHFPRAVSTRLNSSSIATNQHIRVWVPKAVAEKCVSQLRIDSWVKGNDLADENGERWVKLFVNGKEKMTLHHGSDSNEAYAAGEDYARFEPGELLAGWNDFHMAGAQVNSSGYYLIDYYRFSVLEDTSTQGTVLFIK